MLWWRVGIIGDVAILDCPEWEDLVWMWSRAWNEGYPKVCKDFTITEKAPTRDLVGATCPRGVGAFFVIVKYSFNLRLKLYRAGRGRAAAL